MTIPENLLRRWLETPLPHRFQRELIEETEGWLNEFMKGGGVECNAESARVCTQSVNVPGHLCDELGRDSSEQRATDSQSTRIRELEAQVEKLQDAVQGYKNALEVYHRNCTDGEPDETI